MASRVRALFALCAVLLCGLPCPSRAFVAVAVEGYGRGRLIRSVDSGETWSTLVEAYINLHAVATPSPYSVVAVGDNGTIITAAPNITLPTALSALYTTASSGTAAQLASSVPAYASYYPGSYSSLLSQYAPLAAATNTTAFASLNGSVSRYYTQLATPPHTTAWTPSSLSYKYATLSHVPTADFRAVAFLSPLLGVTVGTTGVVYRSVDGGGSWSSVATSSFRDLNGLAFASSGSGGGWAVLAAGNVGTVLRSLDTGLTWQQLNLSTVGNLYAVAMYSYNQAAVCGDAGALLTSSDGGSAWLTMPQPQWANVSFYSVAYHNASTLYVTAGRSTLLVSRDGGVTLSRVPLLLNGQLDRFGGLFLTPSVLTMAARNRLYAALLPSPASASPTPASNSTIRVASGAWTPLTAVNINAISAVAVLEAGVLTVAVPSLNLSAYLGSNLAFNVTLTNTGTDTLSVTSFTSADARIALTPLTTDPTFPFSLAPYSAAVVLDFTYLASLLPDTTTTSYYTNLTLLTTTPTQRTSVYFSLYLLPLPSSSSPSFLSQYWYVLALALGAVAVLLIVFVRRRLRYVRRWNRRVLYLDEKIEFWGCWLLSQEIEHDSDSEFWSESEQEDEDEAEGEEYDDEDGKGAEEGSREGEEDEVGMGEGELMDGEEGEEFESSTRGEVYRQGSGVKHTAHRRKQSKPPRHQLVWRDDDEADDGWDEGEDGSTNSAAEGESETGWRDGGEADEEDTDSSISDPDDFFYQRPASPRRRATQHQFHTEGEQLRHRGAGSRQTVVADSRRQSHHPAQSVDSATIIPGRMNSVVMADVARLAAAARHSVQHGH